MAISESSNDIAIVGMAGRFPGARSTGALWELAKSGGTALKVRSIEDAVAAGVPAHLAADPAYVNLDATIEDVDAFDASFFDIGPRDAAIMDPQHRHFLECAWEALEDAAYVPEKFDGAIGVYAGSGMNGYILNNLLTNSELVESLGMFLLRHTSNDKDFLSTGVSYRLNLTGPSVNVQTACSTSLVAIHLASQALLSGECDMALAGGVTIEIPHGHGYLYREGEILSPDGFCRAFDAQSKGTVLTSGVGVVVLRRLADALAAGDHIHAVIKASAINNDGAGKVGYLAPSVDGHAAVVSEALALAGVSADSIQYVEAHGTGTALGDPIEVAALTRAFRESTQRSGFVRLGSIKPTVGHLDTAAGVASVIKTAMALDSAVLPPMSNFSAPNPLIGIGETPFVLSGEASPWPRGSEPRRAGVSSLGVGGTNAHVILEEAPLVETGAQDSGGQQLLVLSAKSEAALERATRALATTLSSGQESVLADVAFTLQTGRAEFAHRRAVTASSCEEAAAALAAPGSRQVADGIAQEERPSVVFMFPGGGAQYPNMGRELYDEQPVYRDAIDTCFSLLEPTLATTIRPLLFPSDGCVEAAAERMAQPSLQLPAIFMTEYALAQLWISWGIKPVAMTGHSLGEYAAACISGVMSLADALQIVALRGEIMERAPRAAMLSVALSEAELVTRLPGELSLAAVNAPDLCVVSGPATSIDGFDAVLTSDGIATRRIKISGAVHCNLLDPFLADFQAGMARVHLSPPTTPYISNVTGTWVRPEDATDPRYWVRHLRHTVRFSAGLSELLRDPNRVLIEVGPGTTLTALARQQRAAGARSVSSLPHPQEPASSSEHMLLSLGRVWTAGLAVDWARLHNAPRRKVSLPTYPFEREKHWIEPGRGDRAAGGAVSPRPLDEWFATPAWTLAPLRATPPVAAAGQSALVLVDESGTGLPIAAGLRRRGYTVTTAIMGGPETPFLKVSPTEYHLNPGSRDDHEQLVEQLAVDGLFPSRVLHTGGLWSGSEGKLPRIEAFRLRQERGFFSLLFLLRSLGKREPENDVLVTALTRNARFLDGDRDVSPDAATMAGPAKVATREFPHLRCKTLDIDIGEPPRRFARRSVALAADQVERIIDEALVCPEDDVVALRSNRRWVQTLRKVTPGPSEVGSSNSLKPGGCYLISGGFGGLAGVFADELARAGGARLVLVGRTPHAEGSARVRELEALGAEVLAISADVTNREQMSRAVAKARERFGPITGVIHAAGTIDDSPLEMKEREGLAAVVSPKAAGALVLEQVLDFSRLDFALLCSSTSALLGPAGQADYAAANAFLDAFAQHRTALGDRNTIAVNWGMWKEIGMTAGRAAATAEARAQLRTSGHPLLGDVVRETAGETWFESVVSPATDWVLDEHRLADGTPVMPGAAVAEIVRAAASELLHGPLEVRDLEFHRPLVARDPQRLQIRAAREAGGVAISLRSGPAGTPDGLLVERAHAFAVACTASQPGVISIPNLEPLSPKPAACAPSTLPTGQYGQLKFGPRWDNLRSASIHCGRAIAKLSLHEDYRHEADEVRLHPALLDIATGLGLELIPGYSESKSFYVPLAYGRLRMFGPLPATVLASVSLTPGEPSWETASFDVALANEAGEVMVELTDLVLRKVLNPASVGAPDHDTPASPRSDRPFSQLMKLGLAHGISAAHGAQAFRAALSFGGTPQLVVSPVSIEALAEACEQDASTPSPSATVARPQLKTGFEPPRDPVEQQLAEWWSELLGVRDVGVNDDFFDLGGHSLIAVRFTTRVRKTFGIQLALATLFGRPTIATLAEFIRGEAPLVQDATHLVPAPASTGWSSLVPIQPLGSKRPFFCVHGMYGNVLNLRPLAARLGADQPFYGLQQRGLNGIDTPHGSFEEMAAAYLEEIRSIQPNGPYAIGGYSGGGLIAFEMAQQLRAVGEDVALLAMLDTPGPDLINRSWSRRFARFAHRLRAGGLRFAFWRARQAQHNLRLTLTRKRPEVIVLEDEQLTVGLGTHMMRLQNAYSFRPLDGAINLFRATEREPTEAFLPRELGWKLYAEQGVEVVDVPGGHLTMCLEPNVSVLANAISRKLDSSDVSARFSNLLPSTESSATTSFNSAAL